MDSTNRDAQGSSGAAADEYAWFFSRDPRYKPRGHEASEYEKAAMDGRLLGAPGPAALPPGTRPSDAYEATRTAFSPGRGAYRPGTTRLDGVQVPYASLGEPGRLVRATITNAGHPRIPPTQPRRRPSGLVLALVLLMLAAVAVGAVLRLNGSGSPASRASIPPAQSSATTPARVPSSHAVIPSMPAVVITSSPTHRPKPHKKKAIPTASASATPTPTPTHPRHRHMPTPTPSVSGSGTATTMPTGGAPTPTGTGAPSPTDAPSPTVSQSGSGTGSPSTSASATVTASSTGSHSPCLPLICPHH